MSVFPLLEGGNAVRFFHLALSVSGPVSFAVFLSFLLSKGRFLEKFSGANFCFRVVVLVLCFLVGFCLCFCFIFGVSLPKLSGKNSIDVRSGVFLGSVSFGFFADVVFCFVFFFKRQRSGSSRTPPRTHLFFWFFSFCVPPLLSVPPVLAVRPASWRFAGVPFWAPGVFGILLGPSEAFFLGREAATHTFSRMTGGGLTNPAVVSPAPRPSEGQGEPIFGRGHLGRPLFGDFVGIFCCLWGQGPTDALRPGPFCMGRGPFVCPLTGPFHTARFSRPRFFFFFFSGRWGQRLPWRACWSLAFCLAFVPRGAAEWLARVDCSAPRNPRRTLRLHSAVWIFSYGQGGSAVRSFLGIFSGDCPSSLCGFFRVRHVLGFFGGFVGMNFGMGVRGFVGRIFVPKNAPLYVPTTAKNEVLPF